MKQLPGVRRSLARCDLCDLCDLFSHVLCYSREFVFLRGIWVAKKGHKVLKGRRGWGVHSVNPARRVRGECWRQLGKQDAGVEA